MGSVVLFHIARHALKDRIAALPGTLWSILYRRHRGGQLSCIQQGEVSHDPFSAMTNYRFCYLNGAGQIVNREERECAGELGALEYARALSSYQAIEIWDGSYRVAHIRKGDDPLAIYARPLRWHWVLADN